MTYGEKITKLRKEANLTQAELGEKLGVSAQAVSKWEHDLAEPDLSTLKNMCNIFEVSIDEFLNNEIKNQDNNENPIDSKQDIGTNVLEIVETKPVVADKEIGFC